MADKIKLFGRSYNQIGNSDADVIIKTKGQLKLQYGNKFIDLIKDGKLNVNTEFIFKAKSIDDIAGNDGIYVCDDGSIYLKVSNFEVYKGGGIDVCRQRKRIKAIKQCL